MKRMNRFPGSLLPAMLALGALQAGEARAHCDGLDGPVVTAARKALDSNQVERVLIWVPAAQEGPIQEAFRKTQAVRKLGGEAKDLADHYFFETVVRIHRDAEGAPYTGLKPAGRDLGPAIPAADRALADGKPEPLARLLERDVRAGLKASFEKARATAKHPLGDLGKGRAHVAAYVDYIHYVERIHEAAKRPPHGHFEEVPSAESAAGTPPGHEHGH